jgi:hypothetical protein
MSAVSGKFKIEADLFSSHLSVVPEVSGVNSESILVESVLIKVPQLP